MPYFPQQKTPTIKLTKLGNMAIYVRFSYTSYDLGALAQYSFTETNFSYRIVHTG